MPIDFVPTSVVKAATRSFTAPITAAATYDGIITTLTGAENPLGATDYQTAGETVSGVTVTDQSYRATIEFIEEVEGKSVGSIVITAPDRAKHAAIINHILADTELSGATCFGGEAVQNTTKDSWSTRVKVHDPTGEIYYLNFTRNALKLSSYENDAILTKVETWADGVTALN